MLISDFFQRLYPCLNKSTVKSQHMFVTLCFVYAGSDHFPLPKSTARQVAKEMELQRQLYKGKRRLTSQMKYSFPNPINYEKLSNFFLSGFKDNLNQLFDAFAIPDTTKKEPKQFALALAQQFELFVRNEPDDVDNKVLSFYTDLIVQPKKAPLSMNKPYYNNDGVAMTSLNRSHTLNCYEFAEHTWAFENTGRTDWINRVLILENENNIAPYFYNTSIPVPNTSSGEKISLTVSLDARGQEGTFDCHWIMVDSDGNNCFPNNKNLFDVRLIIKFTS
ncbi:hypothetical protein ACFC9O_11640 [Enterococcus faecalis]|uniref:hypothetical protein n=1 Tax=Enterococcus faecalis TaxID=1351 RepID=UPI0039A6780F